MQKIPVLIIGGGPAGLSMALALARQNIQSIVIERNPSITNHPRARGVNVRTMELFKQWGNAEELLNYELPKEARRFIWVQSLQGEEITRVIMNDTDTSRYSPTHASFVSQDRIEKSVYHTILKYKETAEVHYLKELISFTEDESGVVAKILNKKNNTIEIIHARYLIAADGVHSNIRKHLNISMHGPADLGQFCSVYCEMDISHLTKHRTCFGYFFVDPKLYTRFLTSVDGRNLWIIGLRFLEGMSKETFTNEYCINEIRELVGLPDLTINIIDINFWTMGAQIAEQYRKGRVFLVGDAAHRLPPTGGFGMNTGIQDAHNLAWKLAFVINNKSSDKLLNTYYDERVPVAQMNIQWSTENAKRFTEIYHAIHSGDTDKLKILLDDQQKHLNFLGLDLGFIYHSSNIISENNQRLSITPSVYMPTTLPGSRAPHVKLIKNGKIISTLDLFEKDFVLLIGSEGEYWRTMANQLTQTFPLKIYRIANDGDLIDPDNVWHDIYNISLTGAVLIRPDGHVAWRSISIVEEAKGELENCFNTVFANFTF